MKIIYFCGTNIKAQTLYLHYTNLKKSKGTKALYWCGTNILIKKNKMKYPVYMGKRNA